MARHQPFGSRTYRDVLAVAAVAAVAVDWSRYEEARSAYALLASSQLLKILAESPVPVASESDEEAVVVSG